MPDTDSEWLMVIDHQPAFSHQSSPWFTPAMAASTRNVAKLVPLYGDRVLFTRFVPPDPIAGSWQAYYGKWEFATARDSDWLWDVDDPWKGRLSISSHTFSKWVPDALAHFGAHPKVTMCGVSTDCCVLATAFAAVDDGAQVTVVSDACAAKSPDVHAKALELLSFRAPQLSLVTTEDELRRQERM